MANSNVKDQDTGLGAYLRGVRSEFKKITWPSRQDTLKYTGIVILVCLIVSLIVYLIDLVFANLLNLIV